MPDLTVPSAGAIAINCTSNVADTTAEHCGFLDCPTAFGAGTEPNTKGGLHCGLINCTILQDPNGYDNATQVLLSGPEAFVMYCEFFQTPMTHEPSPGPTGCTHIAVTSGADGCRIESCHISSAYYGITVADSKFTFIANCKVDAAAGLTMVPADENVTIYGVSVTGCTFGFLEGYTPPLHTSGISIDTAGGPNKNVESISIVGCVVFGYPNAGLLVGNGQLISVVGGKYSSNGQDPQTPQYGAGIVITQTCAQVRVVGADCSGVFHFWGTVVPSPPPQPYGVALLSDATSILVEGCDLTNNATAPLYVSASGTDLRVIDSIGYNDQATVLQSATPPPSNPIAYNIAWANVPQGWYGPVAFYVKGAGAVTIDGVDTYLMDGGYTLSPGETASVAGTATHFLAVGK